MSKFTQYAMGPSLGNKQLLGYLVYLVCLVRLVNAVYFVCFVYFDGQLRCSNWLIG